MTSSTRQTDQPQTDQPQTDRRHVVVPSPIGPITLVVDTEGELTGLYFAEHSPPPERGSLGTAVDARDPAVAGTVAALEAYLRGATPTLEVPAAAVSGTAFQHAVWDEVASIPPGATRSYSEIAAAVGRPTARRSVGAAVAANPLCLLVPCHRVVTGAGRVVGYAGGVERKRWLLALEAGQNPPPLTPQAPRGPQAPPEGAPPSAP